MKEKPGKSSEQEASDSGLASPNSLAPLLSQSSPASLCDEKHCWPAGPGCKGKDGAVWQRGESPLTWPLAEPGQVSFCHLAEWWFECLMVSFWAAPFIPIFVLVKHHWVPGWAQCHTGGYWGHLPIFPRSTVFTPYMSQSTRILQCVRS